MTLRAHGTKGLVWLAVPAIAMASLAGWAFGPRQADATTANGAVAYGFDEGSGSAVSDASPNGRTGSVVSATWTASGRFGDALSFNGSSSRVVTTSSLPVGTSFSLTAWVYDSAGSGYHTIAAAGQARDVYLLDGELWIYGGAGDIDLGVAVPAGRWVQVAVTSDGTTLRGYVDGVAGPATAANLTTSAAAPLQIGAWAANGANYDFFNGRIDEVRWYTRALTAGEISADSSTPVSGGTTPPTTTTVTPSTTTSAPSTTTTAPSGGGGRSLRFFANGRDGIDRVRIPLTPSKSIDVGGDFTIEWWMKVAGPLDGGSCYSGESAWIYGNILLDRDVFGGGDYGDYGVSVFGGGGGTIAFGVTRGSNGNTVCSTAGVADGAWHHVAVTRSSSSGALAIYIDGRERGTASGPMGDVSYRDGRSTSYPNDPYLVIGAEKHDAGSQFPSYPGWLDELRVSRSVRYTGDFTPPSSPLGVDANTVALYHADEGSGTMLGDATGANPGTLMVGGSPTAPVWTTDTPFRPFRSG